MLVFKPPRRETLNLKLYRLLRRQHRWAKLLARMDEVEKTVWSPNRGKTDPRACEWGLKRGGFWGPFIDQDDQH